MIESIEIVWSIEDVKEVRPDLTDEQCGVVLLSVKAHHDCNVGINWGVLRDTADIIFPKKGNC